MKICSMKSTCLHRHQGQQRQQQGQHQLLLLLLLLVTPHNRELLESLTGKEVKATCYWWSSKPAR